jgi:protocatechuate 3,4-dioxygenase beta subunit
MKAPCPGSRPFAATPIHDNHGHGHDHGLAHDLRTLQCQLDRRQALGRLARLGTLGVGGLALAACGGGGEGTSVSALDSGGGSGGSVGSCVAVPEETAGPYPGDGSNTSAGQTANALALAGIVRSDMRSSFGGASGSAAGVPLTVRLRLVDTRASCADLAGFAVYLWHCDAQGRYSMYSSGVTAENYLRAVQSADSSGQLSFVTIFPGCYSGRWPHMHFEIFRSLSAASSFANKLRTSQIALPAASCQAVYAASSDYSNSLRNLSGTSLASDGIFSDGTAQQMATIAGSVETGLTADLTIGIAA